MSQSVKEFVRQSGVDVRQSPNYDSNNNNNFARELEMELERAERARAAERMARREDIARGQQFFREPVRPELQQRRVPPMAMRPPPTRSRFAQFENNSPLENEFADVNVNKLVNNAMREPINTSEFENSNVPPINEAAFEKALAEMNPNVVNEFTDLTPLVISPFRPGMFNAGVDSGYGQKDTVINLKQIAIKKPLAKMRIADGLYIETKEIVGRYGQQKIAVRHTRNLGLKGNMNIPLVTIEFKMVISNDDGVSQGTNVNIYKNGKIRFSGGLLASHISVQPEAVRRYIVDNYTTKEPFFYNPIQFNNLSGQFNINGVFRMDNVASKFARYGSVVYEPELTPMMYVTMRGYTLNISKSGVVQIIGAKTPALLENAYKATSQVIRQFDIGEDIIIKKVRASPKKKTKRKIKPVSPPKPKRVVKRKTALNKNQINALKIDGKKCERMDKKELVDLARKMGVVNFRVKSGGVTRDMYKREICDAIKKKSGIKTTKVKNVTMSGKNTTFRIGRKLCRDMTLPQIKQIAEVLKINTNGKQKKDDLCKKIEAVRNNLNKPKPKPISPPKPTKREVQRAKKVKVQTQKTQERVKRVGLDDNSIRKDLEKQYGKAWMNRYKPNLTQDIRNIKNAASRVSANNRNKALGVPKKMVVDKIKKDMVKNWKMQRKRNLEKNYVMKNVNVTGVPNNMKNKWRQAAANEALRRNKAMTAKQFAVLKKKWLKGMASIRGNGNARRNIGAARARVETL